MIPWSWLLEMCNKTQAHLREQAQSMCVNIVNRKKRQSPKFVMPLLPCNGWFCSFPRQLCAQNRPNNPWMIFCVQKKPWWTFEAGQVHWMRDEAYKTRSKNIMIHSSVTPDDVNETWIGFQEKKNLHLSLLSSNKHLEAEHSLAIAICAIQGTNSRETWLFYKQNTPLQTTNAILCDVMFIVHAEDRLIEWQRNRNAAKDFIIICDKQSSFVLVQSKYGLWDSFLLIILPYRICNSLQFSWRKNSSHTISRSRSRLTTNDKKVGFKFSPYFRSCPLSNHQQI